MLFDAVGTLIELREPLGETYARVARDHGVSLPARDIEDAFRRIFRRAPPMVFAEAPDERIAELERAWWHERVRATFLAAQGTARFADFDAFFQRLYETFARPSAWRCAPGARELLASLRTRGLATGVVSNFDQRLPKILQGLDLAALLDVIVLPAQARAAKPAAAIFALALERLGARPEEAVYVGDDAEHDVEGARAAGLCAIDAKSLATLSQLPRVLEELDRRAQTRTATP